MSEPTATNLDVCPECGGSGKVLSSRPKLSTLKCEFVPCPTCQSEDNCNAGEVINE